MQHSNHRAAALIASKPARIITSAALAVALTATPMLSPVAAYAASQALVAAGVVPLADMTPEAALARLTVLLATETDPQRVRQQLAGGRPGEWSNAPA